MTTGVLTVRAVLGVIGALMMLGGALLFVFATPFGLWLIVSGAILVVAVIIERSRYRSQAAERTHMA